MNNWSEIERLERKCTRQVRIIKALMALFILLILSAGVYFYNLPETKKPEAVTSGISQNV